VRATIQAAMVVVTVRIVLLSMLLVVFPGIIDNVCNDGRNIVVVGDGRGIICGSTDVMITIKLIMFNNVGVRIKLIPITKFFRHSREGILICWHFFLLDIVVIFLVPVILIVEIGTREVVTKHFAAPCALIVVVVCRFEVDATSGNHCDIFRYGRDRKVVGCTRSLLRFGVVFCRSDALRNEVLFLSGIEGVFMLP